METRAAILHQINKSLLIEDLILPDLKTGQVLVKVAFSSLCHSQLNEILGLKGEDKFLPHTLGHEGSGIVESIGANVKKVMPGDHVVISWIKGKGADVPSSSYKKMDGSLVNSGAISTFLTRAVISENRLVKISKMMPLREAALLGCAIPTGAGIVKNTAKIQPGSSVAIFGLGGIGLSALLASKIADAAIIIAIDIDKSKLQDAFRFGATHTLNGNDRNLLSKIIEITTVQKGGVDFSIEAVGKKESMEMAFRATRPYGGLCIIAGNLKKGECIFLDPFDLIKGKRIIGSWGGDAQIDRDIPFYVKLHLSKKLRLDELISSTFKLQDINCAFDRLATGVERRILIDMQ